MYDPKPGRFTTEDPLLFAEHDLTNPYSYVGNDPTNRTDPSGLAWLDPNRRGIGYTGKLPKKDSNCVGAALGIEQELGCKRFADKKYVPFGCREVTGEGITKWASPCRRGETELIVGWVVEKDKSITCHAIGRDKDALTLTWRTKLGSHLAPGDSLVASGQPVLGITDWRGHFEWYFKEISNAKPAAIRYRAFCCDKSKLRIVNGNLSDLTPAFNRD